MTLTPRSDPAPRHNEGMPDAPDVLEVDLEGFAAAYAAGATVLDVRNPDEYTAAHVPGAVLIPLDQLAARRDEIPAGDPLYVICALGGRSLTAATALAAAGYPAVSVAGGTNGWIERGGAVVTGDQPLGS
jgi:thioredoxin 1